MLPRIKADEAWKVATEFNAKREKETREQRLQEYIININPAIASAMQSGCFALRVGSSARKYEEFLKEDGYTLEHAPEGNCDCDVSMCDDCKSRGFLIKWDKKSGL
jgi:hypothetical protein